MGIELRDRIALVALEALIQRGVLSPGKLASDAYVIADAMLVARVADVPAPTIAPAPASLPNYCAPTQILQRKSTKPKATADMFSKIIELHKAGWTNKAIADHLKINGQSVNGVVATSVKGHGGTIIHSSIRKRK